MVLFIQMESAALGMEKVSTIKASKVLVPTHSFEPEAQSHLFLSDRIETFGRGSNGETADSPSNGTPAFRFNQTEFYSTSLKLIWFLISLSEIVPLRKVFRQPETDYRLQQLHTKNEPGSVNQLKIGADLHNGNTLRVYPPAEPMQKQQRSEAAAAVPSASHLNASVTIEAKVLQPKNAETNGTSPVTTSTGGDVGISPVPQENVAPESGAATNAATVESIPVG
ncbi:uncharacterized protein LOC130762349 [Actinidia eriantha]|uniref:uncharacterized protein LOC130762349 n=1 Tax=Actinidia eriantha TaxID=165200 RepID=UPI0025890B0C|nr:uncharacterized protein LOC130762349 [Actinidia eriantha]